MVFIFISFFISFFLALQRSREERRLFYGHPQTI